MYTRIIAILLLLAAASNPAAGAGEGYGCITVERNSEAYGSEADEISLADARSLLLEYVNAVREADGQARLDVLDRAERVCQAHALEMAEYRYGDHHNLSGLKCERRFNMAGGSDHVLEVFAVLDIEQEVYLTPQVVGRIMEVWLDSESHRQTILDDRATGLGCGFETRRSEDRTFIAAVALVVRDYGNYTPLPLTASLADGLEISGSFNQTGVTLAYIGVAREDAPFARIPEYQREHPGPYSQPAPFMQILPPGCMGRYDMPGDPVRVYSVDCSGDESGFITVLHLDTGFEPGLYYFTVWASNGSDPFCTMTQTVLLEE